MNKLPEINLEVLRNAEWVCDNTTSVVQYTTILDDGIKITVLPTFMKIEFNLIGFNHTISGEKAQKIYSFVESAYKEMIKPLIEFMNEIV